MADSTERYTLELRVNGVNQFEKTEKLIEQIRAELAKFQQLGMGEVNLGKISVSPSALGRVRKDLTYAIEVSTTEAADRANKAIENMVVKAVQNLRVIPQVMVQTLAASNMAMASMSQSAPAPGPSRTNRVDPFASKMGSAQPIHYFIDNGPPGQLDQMRSSSPKRPSTGPAPDYFGSLKGDDYKKTDYASEDDFYRKTQKSPIPASDPTLSGGGRSRFSAFDDWQGMAIDPPKITDPSKMRRSGPSQQPSVNTGNVPSQFHGMAQNSGGDPLRHNPLLDAAFSGNGKGKDFIPNDYRGPDAAYINKPINAYKLHAQISEADAKEEIASPTDGMRSVNGAVPSQVSDMASSTKRQPKDYNAPNPMEGLSEWVAEQERLKNVISDTVKQFRDLIEVEEARKKKMAELNAEMPGFKSQDPAAAKVMANELKDLGQKQKEYSRGFGRGPAEFTLGKMQDSAQGGADRFAYIAESAKDIQSFAQAAELGAVAIDGVAMAAAPFALAMGAAAAGAYLLEKAAMAPITAFNAMTQSVMHYVEEYNPSAVKVFNMTMRDASAAMGAGFNPVIQESIVIVRDFADAIYPAMKSLAPAMTALMDAIQPIAFEFNSILGASIRAIAPVVNVAASALKAISPAIQGAMSLLTASIGAMANMFSSFAPLLNPIFETLGIMANGVGELFGGIGKGVTELFNMVTLGAFSGDDREGTQGLAAAKDARYSSIEGLGRDMALQTAISTSGSPSRDPQQDEMIAELRQSNIYAGEQVEALRKMSNSQLRKVSRDDLAQANQEVRKSKANLFVTG